jgi:hypothetical protein
MHEERLRGHDWQHLAVESHYRTAVSVTEALEAGDYDEARRGMDELIDAMSHSERRVGRRQLMRFMQPIIQWRGQPERRSPGWAATIVQARDEIADAQEETPSMSDAVIRGMGEYCFQRAKRYAERAPGRSLPVDTLSWDEVFEAEYRLPEDGVWGSDLVTPDLSPS